LNKSKAELKSVQFPLRPSRIQTPLDPYTKATAMKHGALKARFFERWACIGVSASAAALRKLLKKIVGKVLQTLR
jgi:hypothetical protein